MAHYNEVSYEGRIKYAEWEALQEEIGRPIRVLNNGGRTWRLDRDHPWTFEHLADSGFSAEEAANVGITVVDHGSTLSAARRDPTRWQWYPCERYGIQPDDPTSSGHAVYEALVPNEANLREGWSLLHYMPIDWPAYRVMYPSTLNNHAYPDEWSFGEIGERTIILNANLAGLEGLPFDVFLKTPVLASFDTTEGGWAEQMQQARRLRQLERYIEITGRRDGREIIRLNQRINEHEQIISNNNEQIITSQNALRTIQAQVDAYLANQEDRTPREVREQAWDAMNNDSRIEEVKFEGSLLVIQTKPFDIMHPDPEGWAADSDRAYLGKFRVEINMDQYGLRIYNMDNQSGTGAASGGRNHPHIPNHGDPCLGEMHHTIHTMVQNGNLWPAVEMVFAVIRSVNLADDWGRHIREWFTPENLARPLAGRFTDGTTYDVTEYQPITEGETVNA